MKRYKKVVFSRAEAEEILAGGNTLLRAVKYPNNFLIPNEFCNPKTGRKEENGFKAEKGDLILVKEPWAYGTAKEGYIYTTKYPTDPEKCTESPVTMPYDAIRIMLEIESTGIERRGYGNPNWVITFRTFVGKFNGKVFVARCAEETKCPVNSAMCHKEKESTPVKLKQPEIKFDDIPRPNLDLALHYKLPFILPAKNGFKDIMKNVIKSSEADFIVTNDASIGVTVRFDGEEGALSIVSIIENQMFMHPVYDINTDQFRHTTCASKPRKVIPGQSAWIKWSTEDCHNEIADIRRNWKFMNNGRLILDRESKVDMVRSSDEKECVYIIDNLELSIVEISLDKHIYKQQCPQCGYEVGLNLLPADICPVCGVMISACSLCNNRNCLMCVRGSNFEVPTVKVPAMLEEEFKTLGRFDFCTGPREMVAYGGDGVNGDEVYEALESIKRSVNAFTKK